VNKLIDKIPANAWLAIVAVGTVVAVGYYAKKNAVALGKAVNPANPDNVAYSSVNALGDHYDDGINNDSFSLGAWFYDITHPYDGFEFSSENPLANLTTD